MKIIKEKSRYIDEQINMKEQSLNYNNGQLNEAKDLNKLIVDSIEAKLAVLNGLNGYLND